MSSDSILVYDSPPGTWNVVCNALIQEAQRSGREQESQHPVHGYGGKQEVEERKVK